MSQELRDAIHDVLKLLSDASEQVDYEKNVPIADVPSELMCMWLNDSYHPDDSHFRETFSPSELESLRQFNETFSAVLRKLGGSLPPLRVLHASAEWKRLSTAAFAALESLRG